MSNAQLLSSRPLRASVAVVGGWVAVRAAMLWPHAQLPLAVALDRPHAPLPPAQKPWVDVASPVSHRATVDQRIDRFATTPQSMARPFAAARKTRHFMPSQMTSAAVEPPVASLVLPLADVAAIRERPATLAVAAMATPNTLPPLESRKRFSVSAWALVRGDGAPNGLAPSGALGGSQAGVRAFYEPGPYGLAVTARVSAPLGSRTGREAAIGVAVRHGAAGAIVEQRFALEGNRRSQPSATIYGGVYDVRLPARLRLSGYAQAGAVGLDHPQGFVDGALRIERPVARKLSIGIGAWAGAQPAVARLDIGPEVAARIPAGPAQIRIAVAWRARVAGNAQPGSGLTLSAGLDF